jgi:protein SCO1/2
MTNRTVARIALAALIGGIAALGWAHTIWSSIGAATRTESSQGPMITSDFELVDQTGRTVRDEDLGGKWQLVFFGFTSCPDICPTTLSNVTAALEELGPAAERLQPLS